MKKISRRSFLAAAAVSAAALALTACGGASSSVASSAASSAAASSSASGSLATVVAGKLTMATNATFPPYEMTTDSGDIAGIDIDTAKAIAEKLGLELQVDDMEFDAALLSVQQGKADMVMAGVTVTDERKAVMDFSDSYATGIQSIIVPNGSDIASPDDLAGKKIGTQRGTTGYIYCSDDFGDDAVVAYDSGLTAVQALNNGQVDAVVIDNAPAKEYVAANPGLKVLDTSYAEEDYAIGLAKGSALEDAINAALEELKADGTLQSIVDKYITAEYAAATSATPGGGPFQGAPPFFRGLGSPSTHQQDPTDRKRGCEWLLNTNCSKSC